MTQLYTGQAANIPQHTYIANQSYPSFIVQFNYLYCIGGFVNITNF